MPYESAPFLRRLGARLLDLVFCYALAFILAVPVALILFLPIIVFMDEVPDIMPSIGAIICLFLAYVGTEGFLLVRREGQTLGKGLLGLRVIPVGNSRLSLLSALVRLAVILSPFVFMSLAGSFKDNAVLDLIASIGAISLFVSLVLTVIPPAGSRRTLLTLPPVRGSCAL
ncbi:RDD family protein [Gordonia sp. TBRC 11910]|uniref:RDD family protein n=1 Tax=Gordonia asplenii TaxID=2725283 RepID=A0A848L9S9_9ACTN|nr:RDD family protein [Gordonia asplenii]NMO05211.1 RDD family protein [Gordonia asplenii]